MFKKLQFPWDAITYRCSEWGVADWARWTNRLGYGKRSKQQNVAERQRSRIRAGDFASVERAKNL